MFSRLITMIPPATVSEACVDRRYLGRRMPYVSALSFPLFIDLDPQPTYRPGLIGCSVCFAIEFLVIIGRRFIYFW